MISDLDIDYGVAVTTPYYQLQAADGSLGSHITAGFIHVVGGQYFLSQVDVGTARGVIFNCVEGFQASQYFYEPNGTFIGTGGANAITIKVTSDGVTAIQGAQVALRNDGVLIGTSLTDASGNTSGISANGTVGSPATYALTVSASTFLNYSSTITVSAPATFTITMMAVSPPSPPSDPTLQSIYGTLRSIAGPVENAVVTVTLVPSNSSRPLSAGGNTLTFTSVDAITASDGSFSVDVPKTSGLDDPATYQIVCAAAQIKVDGILLDATPLDISTL